MKNKEYDELFERLFSIIDEEKNRIAGEVEEKNNRLKTIDEEMATKSSKITNYISLIIAVAALLISIVHLIV